MGPFRDCHTGIDLTEILNLTGVLDNALELELIHVADISRVKLRMDFEEVVGAYGHVSSDYAALFILSSSVDNAYFLFYDAMITKGNVPSFRDDLTLWMDHAVLTETNFTLDVCLLCEEEQWVSIAPRGRCLRGLGKFPPLAIRGRAGGVLGLGLTLHHC